MNKILGIVKETKNEWERRVPLIPGDIKDILARQPLEFAIQPSKRRVFTDEEFKSVGVQIRADLSNCDIILGIKEIKIPHLLPNKVYLYFSHTIKGQFYNMPMLQKLLDLNCTLIDYECISDEQGQRLIYFSLHAGLAGIIDSLWAFGQRLNWEAIPSPFKKIKQAYHYGSLTEAQEAFKKLGAEITDSGLPDEITPLVIGITGYGNVSRGVQQLLDMLPVTMIEPKDLKELKFRKGDLSRTVFKVVFKEQDMFEPVALDAHFDLQEYYYYPEKYRSKFEKYLPYLSILVNASFWDTPYPKHVTKSFLKKLFSAKSPPSLKVIGDISCDIDGGVECTLKATDPGNPIYSYDAINEKALDGFTNIGPVVIAVDNLPSELPLDASIHFSSMLKPLIPDLIKTDFSVSFKELMLPDKLKNAVIVHKGQLTPEYCYLKEYL